MVRALHLVMTGRTVPPGREVDGIRHVVGVLDQRAYLARRSMSDEPGPIQGGGSQRAWWASDDPKPGLVFAAQLGPWGRIARRRHRPTDYAAPTAWRQMVQSTPAPIPFDKPGPPRPVERWRATMDVEGSPTPVLVAVAHDEEASQRLQHERDARSWAVAQHIPVPQDLGNGAGWLISELIDSTPTHGAEYVDRALQITAAIRASTVPPPAAVSSWQGSRRDLPRRLMRALIGRLPMREFRQVRAEAANLPADVWVHGDFSNANVMNSPADLRIIDWEFSGQGIWGTDEVRLWSTLDDPADRQRLMTGFLAELPPQRRQDTGVLIHWLAVRQLAENLAAPRRHQNPANIRLGHVVLGEAREWREHLTQNAAT